MAKLIVIARWLSLLAIPLFWGHFIGFMAGHFLFINLIFINRGMNTRRMDQFSALTPVFNEIWLSLLALTASHGISFYINFVRRKEYEGGNVIGMMLAPYKRVAIMHCTILLGGFGSLLLGEPAIALIVLIAMKLLMDSRSHLKEHQPPDPGKTHSRNRLNRNGVRYPTSHLDLHAREETNRYDTDLGQDTDYHGTNVPDDVRSDPPDAGAIPPFRGYRRGLHD